jgi:hypothetical protein
MFVFSIKIKESVLVVMLSKIESYKINYYVLSNFIIKQGAFYNTVILVTLKF